MLDEGGVVRHFGELNRIDFGARDGGTDARLAELHAAFAQTPVEARLSSEIEQELWDKFVFLATFAEITSLMRASIGTVLETPAGEALILRLSPNARASRASSATRRRRRHSSRSARS